MDPVSCLQQSLPLLLAGISSLAAQGAPFTVPFEIPSHVGKARLKDSAFVGDAMAYHYEGRGITGLDEYVWPLDLASADSTQRDSLLQLQVATFKQAIPLGIDRGWYDKYELAFDAPHPVPLAGDSVPGYVVAFAFVRSRKMFTSFFYIYAVRGMYLKIRLTVPGEDWGTNPALDIPAELVRVAAQSNR